MDGPVPRLIALQQQCMRPFGWFLTLYLHAAQLHLWRTLTYNNNDNNITACPPMISNPHQWLCLLWSKPRKNYEHIYTC
jgi:hypothetical protein